MPGIKSTSDCIAALPEKARDIIVILGIPFDNLTMREMIQTADEFIKSGKPHYVVTANLNYLALSLRDPEFRDIILTADRITADGMPVIWASKLLGCPLKERVTGSDMGPELAKLAAEKGYSIYLLGGEEDVARIAVENLLKKHPTLKIAGYYSPPFNPLLEMNEEEIFNKVKEAKPDILLVSLAGGKTEKWIRMNYVNLKVPFAIGVGATIDFIAGKVSRAPKWMQKFGLEWLFRLVNEPKRLFKRYANDGFICSYYFMRQYLYHIKNKKHEDISLTHREIHDENKIDVFKFSGTLESKNITKIENEVLSKEKHASAILDFSDVSCIDSKGIGFLIGLKKKLEEDFLVLTLIRVSDKIIKLFDILSLTGHFKIFDGEKKAAEYINANAMTGIKLSIAYNTPDFLRLAIGGRVNSQTREKIEARIITLIEQKDTLKELYLDFTNVDFLDSSGLSMLIKIYKRLLKENAKLYIENTSPFVKKILNVSQAYKYLNII